MTPQLDVQLTRMIIADWFGRLAREAGLPLDQYGSSGNKYTLGSPNNFHVTANFKEKFPFLDFCASDPNKQHTVDSLADQAARRVTNGDFGGTVWYEASLITKIFSTGFSFFDGTISATTRQSNSYRRLEEIGP